MAFNKCTPIIFIGIAGFEPADIAPLFLGAKNMENIFLPEEFWDLIG